MSNVLTTDHADWKEFAERLEGPEGCHFIIPEGGTIKDLKWSCSHDHKFSRVILKDMGFDIDETIEYFENNGGYCDCEVLFNVA